MSDFAKDINVPANDCISRQAAIDVLADMHCKSDEDGYVWIIRSDAWARIDALPSAQPDTGKATWAIHTYMPHNYYCTNCKQDSPYNKIWDFCPHCGFKMEDYV